MESRGNKRMCLETQTEVTEHAIKQCSRVFSKLRIQMHLDQVVKVIISLAIPLMSTLKSVLAVMMRVADPEDVDMIEDLMSNMIQDKKMSEKGKNKKTSKNAKGSPRSKASTSVGSFEVISEGMNRSHRAASSSQTPGMSPASRVCFCGLKPNLLVCRMEGPNFMRKFYRCPKPSQHQTQCDYFAWTENTKAEEYEKLYYQDATMDKPQKSKPTKKKSKSVSAADSSTSSGDDLDLAQSPASSSPKTPPRQARCQHEWSRRGSTAYVKMKTCNLCGLRETFRYKDGLKTTSTVDVSEQKKSGRPRNHSP